MAIRFAARMAGIPASAVRELLKLTARRDLISFGGGLPPNECFPLEALSEAAARVLAERGADALQYSTTEGCAELRRAVAQRMQARLGIDTSPDQILITAGSQQAIDLTGRIFLDEGDIVFCESPTYLAALNAFRVWRPRLVDVPSDDNGMIVSELARTLEACDRSRAKLVYVVPDFQNPTGRTWSLERRLELLDVAARHELPVIEDSPYRELRFEGGTIPPIKSLDRRGLVVFLSTFSKILSPGLRLGWVAGPPAVIEKYVLGKQGADLHTSTFTQLLVTALLERFDLDSHVERIRDVCRVRRDAMVAALERELPGDVRFTRPSGGLFLWLELPAQLDARQLLRLGLQHGVAFPPGEPFFANGGHANTLRLAYSDSPEPRIAEGIGRLGAAYRHLAGTARQHTLDEAIVATVP